MECVDSIIRMVSFSMLSIRVSLTLILGQINNWKAQENGEFSLKLEPFRSQVHNLCQHRII